MSAMARAGNVRGVSDLRLVGRQVLYEQLGFWLNPVAAAFTIGFSVIFLVLIASTSGNSRLPQLHGLHEIQYQVPAFAAYGVMAACFNTLAVSLVVRREMGLLKRLRLSPLPTGVMLVAIFVNALIVACIQVVVLLVIGKLAYHVSFPHNVGALVLALVVGAICFTALGIAASTMIPNQEASGPMLAIVFFVLLFLSGLYYPISPNSGLAQFSAYFPVRHMILAAFAPFDLRPGVSGWSWGDIRVIAYWGVGGIVVSLRRWSWAPRRSDPGRKAGSVFARLR